MKQKDLGDILGGLLMIAIGVFAVFYAQRYAFGSPALMGPGFFPVILGGVLVLLGTIIAIPAFLRSGPPVDFDWKALGVVIGSIVLFAFTLRPLGLIFATMLAVFAAASADRSFRLLGRVALAAALAALVYVVFRVGLGMNLPVWPRGF